ncbi:MAG: glycoside hydrolase family 15 protein [Acidimicrobiales bacterium]
MAGWIEDYALIGDNHTAALVGRDGSIDWMCLPRFDSGACFAALLGDRDNGRWLLRPAASVPVETQTRRYREDTLVLETEYTTSGGSVRVTDFMPPRDQRPDVHRIVEGITGTVDMEMELVIRFDYGAQVPWVHQVSTPSGPAVRAVAGPDAIVLRTPVATEGQDLRTHAAFTVSEGERIPFSLTWFPSHLPVPDAVDPVTVLADTVEFWKGWTGELGDVHGPWKDQARRSLITLKALAYQPTGGIVAAATTSLPEAIGGVRNWDYRFCWVRDASLTLSALLESGAVAEAAAWRRWLLRAAAGSPDQLQIMYGPAGERRLTEWELAWLCGYEESQPVRVGNAASEQFQLDVYGELMNALEQARGHIDEDRFSWALQRSLMDSLETRWHEPDNGIWEVRGPKRHFVHSKVMAWVAFDCAIAAVEKHGLKGPVDRWREIRQAIHDDVCQHGFDEDKGSFVQYYGASDLDASLLMIAMVGFLPPDDDRVAGTVNAIQRELLRDGLVMRYLTHGEVDGLPGKEGTFLPCSFWLVDNLAMLGRVSEAQALFQRLLSLANDLGLLSEEYDTDKCRLVGNFPKAFSHVGLVNSALGLAKALGQAG